MVATSRRAHLRPRPRPRAAAFAGTLQPAPASGSAGADLPRAACGAAMPAGVPCAFPRQATRRPGSAATSTFDLGRV